MKSLGQLMIAIAFLGGSFFAVEQKDAVTVGPFLLMFFIGIVGVVIVRRITHQEAHDEEVVAANINTIEESLQRIVDKARDLDRNKGTIDAYELRHHIDREFPDDQDAFVQARKSIAHSFSLQGYADVMNPFAAGERYLNRVWSASTDGYVDEAHTYIGKAREQFEEALEVFRGLRGA